MHRCSQCGQELTETYYRCWYAGPEEENTVCGDGGCWAEWIQVNMTTIIGILAIFIILWLILKPFILLLIEKENDKYDNRDN